MDKAGIPTKPEIYKILVHLDSNALLKKYHQDHGEFEKLEEFLASCVKESAEFPNINFVVNTCDNFYKKRWALKEGEREIDTKLYQKANKLTASLQRLSQDKRCIAIFLAGTVWMSSSGTARSDVVIDRLSQYIAKSRHKSNILLASVRNYRMGRNRVSYLCSQTEYSKCGYYRTFWPHIFESEDRIPPVSFSSS